MQIFFLQDGIAHDYSFENNSILDLIIRLAVKESKLTRKGAKRVWSCKYLNR